jgi:copper(I)-binding protein
MPFRALHLRVLAGVLIAAALLATPALAHSVTVGSLTITDLWTRATPPGAPTAAGYLTITNKGSEADTLVSATSPDAQHGELHHMAMKDGVMTMNAVDGGIPIPAGGSVKLAPDGFHIMFVTLSAPLKEGGKLPVTLTFAKAGSVTTFLHILAIGASGPGDMDNMGNMKMGK